MAKENGYYYQKIWFDFAFENPDLISPGHTAMYLWFVELNNRMGWSEKFASPASQTMAAIGLKSYNTYKKLFTELVDLKFISLITESKNQYTACIISLSKFDKASIGSLSKTIEVLNQVPYQNLTKQVQSTVQSNDSIIKHINNKTNKHKTISDASQSDGIYPSCMDLYSAFILEKTGVGAKINKVTGASLNKIIAYLKTQVKNKDDLVNEVPNALKYVFANYKSWEKFHQAQLNLNQIESNLINILNAIRNGKSITTKQHSSEQYRT